MASRPVVQSGRAQRCISAVTAHGTAEPWGGTLEEAGCQDTAAKKSASCGPGLHSHKSPQEEVVGDSVENISLYLDVDGVICPYFPADTTDWGTGWQRAGVGQLELQYAAELVGELNELSHRPGVRFVWLTSWEEQAPRYLCRAIGLDGRHWPVLRYLHQRSRYDWWKLEAIRDDFEKHAPGRAIWMDDQLDLVEAAEAWVNNLAPRILGLSPDPRRGISRAELQHIKDFLEPGTAVVPRPS